MGKRKRATADSQAKAADQPEDDQLLPQVTDKLTIDPKHPKR
jgi:hypothetical protein